jgi:hypothetical protein
MAMSTRRAFFAVLVGALLLALPSIAIGFYLDDYVLRAEVAGLVQGSPPAWDLYRFSENTPAERRADIATGKFRWWTSPELRVHLVRPLSSLLFVLDAKVFGAAPRGYHLVLIAWYLALVAAVGALLRHVLPGGTGTLAMLLFAINPAHVFPWGWLSCNHMTIAGTFSALALFALVKARENALRHGPWLAALAIAVSLAAGETGLCGVAFAAAYAALGGPPGETWTQRLALVAPVLATAAIYLMVYVAVGGGGAHGGYVSPLSEPVAFAFAAAQHLPTLLANAVISLPAELSLLQPPPPFAVLGAVGCAAVFALYRAVRPGVPDEACTALRWLVPGALLAMLPTLGGFLGARLLLLPDIGFSALFAVIIRYGFARAPGQRGAALWARRVGAGSVAAIHLVFAAPVALAGTRANVQTARKSEAAAGELASASMPGDRVFVLAASDPTIAMNTLAVLLADSPAWSATCWSVASMAKATNRVTRTGPRALTIEPQGTTLLVSEFETLYRSPSEPLHLGEEVEQCGATYRVAALVDGRPSRIELTLDVPLDDPRVRLLTWDAGHLRPVVPPAMGEATDIAWSPGPIGFF